MPYTPFANVFYLKPFNLLKFGGKIVAHCKAGGDSWRRQLKFLKENFLTNSLSICETSSLFYLVT